MIQDEIAGFLQEVVHPPSYLAIIDALLIIILAYFVWRIWYNGTRHSRTPVDMAEMLKPITDRMDTLEESQEAVRDSLLQIKNGVLAESDAVQDFKTEIRTDLVEWKEELKADREDMTKALDRLAHYIETRPCMIPPNCPEDDDKKGKGE